MTDKYLYRSRISEAKFKGMNKLAFYLHLRETEFRYNHRSGDIYKIILEMCRDKTRN